MFCIKCKFLEQHLQFKDLVDGSEILNHGDWERPQRQYFCALDPAPEGWEPITPMLPAQEADEAIKDAECHQDPQKVLAAVKDELAKYARMLPLVEDALARAKASSR